MLTLAVLLLIILPSQLKALVVVNATYVQICEESFFESQFRWEEICSFLFPFCAIKIMLYDTNIHTTIKEEALKNVSAYNEGNRFIISTLTQI